MSKYASHYETHRPFVKRVTGPLFLVFALFYLCFHAVSGERGLFAWFSENRKLETLKAELAEVAARRQALDRKVKGLSDNSLDLDLLDEQARRELGMAGKGETVYFTDGR